MTDFQVIGGGPNPFPVLKQRLLSSEEILRVLSWDPNHDMDHGRIRATLYKLQAGRYGFGRSREEELLEWSMGVEPKRPPADEIYDNPARLSDWKREPRSLSAGDIEFIRVLGDEDPKKVPARDVRHLAELEASAESESERRLVGRVLGPIRRHHDRKEEEARLRGEIARQTPSGWRCATVRDAWLPLLAQRLAEEARAELEPQLVGVSAELRDKTLASVESEAQRDAQSRLADLWNGLNASAAEKTKAARDRLSALALGADPESSAPAELDSHSSLEEGRRRGRAEREAREAKADAFAGFRRVG